ncbi:hypothetical protein [Paenibacillus donghaensis]|uniref:Uncharacterized protein n=1 Tax=Paenibacillus donghaensis TaxID=414771 RepID=A0A2Z2KGS3_9BACL|nr:hypothetical protein [Paenibacillus donghaensis]ASA23245.1 hypothetical protein B9T62_22010 [Paenibacillus donghaensis]
MLTDYIHYGHTWQIRLYQVKEALTEHELNLSITTLRKGTVHSHVNPAYLERFEGVEIAVFHRIEAIPHYQASLFTARRR